MLSNATCDNFSRILCRARYEANVLVRRIYQKYMVQSVHAREPEKSPLPAVIRCRWRTVKAFERSCAYSVTLIARRYPSRDVTTHAGHSNIRERKEVFEFRDEARRGEWTIHRIDEIRYVQAILL